MNRAVIVGRLTRDPDLKVTDGGIAICNITVAVNRTFKNKQGEYEADFINVVAFRGQAESVADYLKKGSMAGVDGRIQTRNYENKEGQRVYVTEIVADSVQFLDTKGGKSKQQEKPTQQQSDPFADDGQTIDIDDQDSPF